VNWRQANWILEFDIASFFDSLDRSELKKLLQKRIADKSILRLIGKCLHVGVLDGAELSEPSEGTVQGSTLSPLLGNVYLHYVLDLWFAEEVMPRLRGKAKFIRYADDGVFGFELEEDARRVHAVLGKRLKRFGLTLHPEKTRLLDFSRPSPARIGGKSPTTFDFLGFTWYWKRIQGGRWSVRCKTRRARLARAIRAIHMWCKEHRRLPVKEQHAALTRRVQGHINYFGVNGNMRSLRKFMRQVRRKWCMWLRRRSQRTRLNWAKFLELLKVYPLPKLRIVVSIWK
jgi:group II intron reverse transcriptase/maturase